MRENTSDETRGVIMEMHGWLEGSWRPGVDDEELQTRFGLIMPKSELNNLTKARIGSLFLRDNKFMLE